MEPSNADDDDAVLLSLRQAQLHEQLPTLCNTPLVCEAMLDWKRDTHQIPSNYMFIPGNAVNCDDSEACDGCVLYDEGTGIIKDRWDMRLDSNCWGLDLLYMPSVIVFMQISLITLLASS